jgi:hypothetical protein
MNPGDLEATAMDELALAPSEPAEQAAQADEFAVQQQRIDRLNRYYDEVVAELRALIDPLEAN